VLFSMARLDRVKNLTGLVEFYAKSGRLRAACNLVIVGGVVDPSQARGWRPGFPRRALRWPDGRGGQRTPCMPQIGMDVVRAGIRSPCRPEERSATMALRVSS